MSKRILVLALLAGVAALQTGCFPRIRQCIANRWQMHHQYHGGACCTPAFKVPAQAAYHGAPAGCSTCGIEGGGAVMYPGPVIQAPPAGTPTIGAPMPLPGSNIPGNMPPKQ